MTDISRRSFLAGTAAMGGLMMGAAGVARASAPAKFPKKWDLEADIVIVGSGATGMTAAIVGGRGHWRVIGRERMAMS